MLFKSISLSDKANYDQYLTANPYNICDYSFANIFCWQEVYKTEACIWKECLIMRYIINHSDRRYSMPTGFGDKKTVLTDLSEFAASQGDKLVIGSVTDEIKAELEELLPGRFNYPDKKDGDYLCDYLYLSEDLRELGGRRYSAKRNHISKFLRQYGDSYVYKPITKEIIPDCIALNDNWCKQAGCQKSETDYCAVKTALNNFEPLGLMGGAIYIENKMAAFTLGQPCNANTFDIIAEKAERDIDGAYPFINREFAVRNITNYKYINREEDMGIESLKKAKMSYHPYKLVYKRRAELI